MLDRFNIIARLREKAFHARQIQYAGASWTQFFLDPIFRPPIVVRNGKEPMSHLHPDIDKLHLPHGMFIADWRKYRVEDHPALMEYQKRCHAAGLHDPWLRNYAYQFYPNCNCAGPVISFVTTGCMTGLAIAIVAKSLYKVFEHFFPTTTMHTEEYLQKHGANEHH